MITNTFFSIWSKQSINFYFDVIIWEKKIWCEMKQNIKREEKQRTNNSWYYLLYKQKPLRAWKNLKKMLVIICGCACSRVRVCCRRCTMRLAGMVWRAGLLLFYIQYLMRLVGLAIFWDFSLEDEKFYPPDRSPCDGGNGVTGSILYLCTLGSCATQ